MTARWPHTLPDDGIIDPIAVEIAASGIRSVALTPAERHAAAAAILARGGTLSQISVRLRISGSTASRLAAGCCTWNTHCVPEPEPGS
jgi:hypothetical protein